MKSSKHDWRKAGKIKCLLQTVICIFSTKSTLRTFTETSQITECQGLLKYNNTSKGKLNKILDIHLGTVFSLILYSLSKYCIFFLPLCLPTFCTLFFSMDWWEEKHNLFFSLTSMQVVHELVLQSTRHSDRFYTILIPDFCLQRNNEMRTDTIKKV